MICLDAEKGVLKTNADLSARETPSRDLAEDHWGTGRELFAGLRELVGGAEQGAMTFELDEQDG